MKMSGIFDGKGISNAANEAACEAQRAELMQRISQVRATQSESTGPKPSGSGPETTGPIAFHGDAETAGGMGMRKPDLEPSFGGGLVIPRPIPFRGDAETAGGMGFMPKTSETSFQGTDIFSEASHQRRRGEALVNEAAILNHRAMIARTKGDYASADVLQKESFAKKREGEEILESLQSGQNLAFKGGLGVTEIKKVNANSKICRGESLILEGQAQVAASKRTGDVNKKIQGQNKISEGNKMIAEGKKILSQLK